LLDQIRAKDAEIKFEARVGADEARRVRGEVVVRDELDAPPDMDAIRARAKAKRAKKKVEGAE